MNDLWREDVLRKKIKTLARTPSSCLIYIKSYIDLSFSGSPIKFFQISTIKDIKNGCKAACRAIFSLGEP